MVVRGAFEKKRGKMRRENKNKTTIIYKKYNERASLLNSC